MTQLPHTAEPGDAPPGSRIGAVAWAAYLACSWTWCIGMYLPVILVRDHGLWGFLAFAAPNVVGAAAFGWVLARPGSSERLAARHRHAVTAFSGVTIAFHVFWLAWLASWVRGVIVLPRAALLVVAGAAVAFVLVAGILRRTNAHVLAVGLWMLSAATLAVFAGDPGAVEPPTRAFFASDDVGLLWLAPVMMFGFALCPYLDATFHRARQRQRKSDAMVSFTLGFGVLFAAMIGLTLAYAGLFIAAWDADPATVPAVSTTLGTLLLVHMLLQALFTVGVHFHRLDAGIGTGAGHAGVTLACVVAAGLGWLHPSLPRVGGLEGGEVAYRVFMAFYGLLFPAYVWIAMIPTRDGHSGFGGQTGRRKRWTWAFAVGVAAPMYWLGFVARQELWLALGLGVVLAARLVVRGPASSGPGPQA